MNSFDDEFGKRSAAAGNRFFTGVSVNNQLADHAVVVRRNAVSVVDMGIDADAGTAGCVVERDLSGRWRKIAERIFRVDAAFNGMTVERYIFLRQGEFFPGGNADLFLDDVNAGDHFRNRMFHLHTGVHFHEIELVVIAQQKFNGSRTDVFGCLGGFDSRFAHFLAQSR